MTQRTRKMNSQDRRDYPDFACSGGTERNQWVTRERGDSL